MKGEMRYENITLTGKRYKELFETKGGYLEAIQEYYDPKLRPSQYNTARVVCIDLDNEALEASTNQPRSQSRWDKPAMEITLKIQEDGAPGHGYDNFNNRETQTHQDLAYNCSTMGMELVKQCRHSPEINNMDLGVWHILKTAIDNRSKDIPAWSGNNSNEIEAATWKIAKEEWDAIDPIKLYMISMQRRVILEEMILLNGKSILEEPHTGLRRETHIHDDPEFVLAWLQNNN